VTIRRAFAVGKFEVTFDEWDACVRARGCSHNPEDAGWGRGRRPVINISWNDAREYVAWLSRTTGKGYRLLSEAEWEYVARAWTTSAFVTGRSIGAAQANFDATGSHDKPGPGQGRTVAVGSYAPNAFGLHDVHGNVWEWVEDCRNPNYDGAPADGAAWLSGDCERRVLRGGSWGTVLPHLRTAVRNLSYLATTRSSSAGLRVARD
jgi:formylglycine-generating enzyme required for sulfatase activity